LRFSNNHDDGGEMAARRAKKGDAREIKAESGGFSALWQRGKTTRPATTTPPATWRRLLNRQLIAKLSIQILSEASR